MKKRNRKKQKTAYFKGPYHVSFDISNTYKIGLRNRHGDFICVGHHCAPTDKTEATYQLLSTSPELLSVCKEIDKWMCNNRYQWPAKGKLAKIHGKLMAIIEKAEQVEK